MRTFAPMAAVSLMLGLLAACSAAPEGPVGSESDTLLRRPGPVPVGGVGGLSNGLDVTFPPPNATYCPTVNPKCSWNDFGPTAQLTSLGCSHEIQYFDGQAAGQLGGLLSLCPDTPAVHAAFPYGIEAPGICDACLPEAPAGDVYVLIEAFVGPNCPTGCPIGVIGRPPPQ